MQQRFDHFPDSPPADDPPPGPFGDAYVSSLMEQLEGGALRLTTELLGVLEQARKGRAIIHAHEIRFLDAARRAHELAEVATLPDLELGLVKEMTFRSLVAELSCSARITTAAAGRQLFEAQVLVDDLPETLATLGRGEIDYRHAQELAGHALTLPSEALPGFEQAMLPLARETTPSKLSRAARLWREQHHPESIEARNAEARSRRRAFVDSAADGMAYLTLYIEAHLAEAIHYRASETAKHLLAEARDTRAADPAEPADSRTATQATVDVLTDVLLDTTVLDGLDDDAEGRSESGADDRPGDSTSGPAEAWVRPRADRVRAVYTGIRPSVHITVPALSLLGRSTEPAILEGHGPIPIDVARELTARAPSFFRILTDPETGTHLSYSRASYPVPADLKRALRVRDGYCRFPPCGRRARYTDVDHTLDWQHGGETNATNLAHLCRNHHRIKHLTRWSVRQAPNGDLIWTSALGKEYTSHPDRPLIRPRPTATAGTGGTAAMGNTPGTGGSAEGSGTAALSTTTWASADHHHGPFPF